MVPEYKVGGIKELYPRIPLSTKIKGYIALTRPFTLIAPIMAGVFGVLAPVHEITLYHIKTAVYVGVTLALLQAVGQIVNQVVDAELDSKAKPYRPIPRGIVTRDEAMGIAYLLSMIAIARAFTVSLTFGLLSLVFLFFAVFYSLPPLSPRRVNPLLNLFWVSFSRGFMPFIATLSVFGEWNIAFSYSGLALLWCLALQGTKDVNDALFDLEYGIKTVANTYGTTGLKRIASIMLGIYLLLLIYSKQYLFLITFALGIVALFSIDKTYKLVENNLAWALFYIGLGLHYLIVFVSMPHVIHI